MRARLVGLLGIAALSLVGAGATAHASGQEGGVGAPGFHVEVNPVATITSHIEISYDFVFYNCPPAAEMVVDDWQAQEPNKPDAGAIIAGVDYGLSTGEPRQRLVAGVNQNAFLADEAWVGSGHATCGALTVPITGSGVARSVNDISGTDTDE